MDVDRALAIVITDGLGGPHAWARRVQRRLDDREVILLVRDLPVEQRRPNTLPFARLRDLGPLLRGIGPCTVMPNWLWGAYPALARLRERGLDLRIVASCRSEDDESYYGPLLRHADNYDAVFAVSQTCVAELRPRLDAEVPIMHVPTFVERAPDPTRAYSTGPLRLCWVGRLEQQHKRVIDAVRLAAMLIRAGVDVEFTIVGDGSHVADVLAEMSRTPHLGRIRLIGQLDHADIPTFLARQDVIVQTSDVEGLSNSLLEAMGHAVVPVATDVGATKTVVEHGLSGFLFHAGDIDAAAEAIRLLENDRETLKRLGTAAWESTAVHDWEIAGGQFIAALAVVDDAEPRHHRRCGADEMSRSE